MLRVLTGDGQVFIWLPRAIARSDYLTRNVEEYQGDSVTVPMFAPAVSTVWAICSSEEESTHPLGDVALDALACAIQAADFLEAVGAFHRLSKELVHRIQHMDVNELRVALRAADDMPEAVQLAALAEPLFQPPQADEDTATQGAATLAPPPLGRSLSSEMRDDATQAALAHAPTALLRRLKGVDQAWRKRARTELCARACRVAHALAAAVCVRHAIEMDGSHRTSPQEVSRLLGDKANAVREFAEATGASQEQASALLREILLRSVPTRWEHLSDVNVEYLLGEEGWNVVAAGRQLPALARLHGFGFTVDVAAMRHVSGEQAGDELEGEALRACIQPRDGEVPLVLRVAAVAAVMHGTVCGIPVQQLRQDELVELSQSQLGHVGRDSSKTPRALLLAQLLLANGSLTKIDVGYSQIDHPGALELIAAMKGMRLESIRMAGCELRVEGAKVMGELLSSTTSLTRLDLECNALNAEGVAAICEALQSNTETKLASLHVQFDEVGPTGATAVAAMAAVVPSLTSLHLSRAQLCGLWSDMSDGGNVKGTYTAEGITALSEALKGSSSLTSLDLGHNLLRDDAVLSLMSTLKEKDQMKSLGLNGCDMGVEGSKAVADYIRVSCSVTELLLGENGLGEEGTKCICEALKANKTIKELDLSGGNPDFNNIGQAAGAKHIASMLLVNDSVTKLFVNGNNLGDEGASIICDALRESTVTKVQHLVLIANRLGPNAAKGIAAMCAATASITYVNAQFNELEAEGRAILREVVEGRSGLQLMG